jgi:hypothetical protein
MLTLRAQVLLDCYMTNCEGSLDRSLHCRFGDRMKFHGRSYHLATRDFEDVPSFQHVVFDAFGQPPRQAWRTICSLSLFTPLLTIMERLFAIPASQAFCERALWHLRRLHPPSSLKTGPDLTLARLSQYGSRPGDVFQNSLFYQNRIRK